MTNKIRIVGAIASKLGVTLYLEDGSEYNLKTDSFRTKAILDEAVPALARHKIVEVDLDTFSVESRLEKKSGGLLRFVREKVKKIGGFFSLGDEEPETPDPDRAIVLDKNRNVVGRTQKAEEVETLVAYVGDKRIPGVEKLEAQMESAAYGTTYKGFENFMKRLASVIDQRGHSVQELLHFMERGDLPIADDGSIIGYKVLKTKGSDSSLFVDCHSGNVRQRLGSRVYMKEASVDPSKRTQCSTGLHIARRRYLRGFSGNIITIVKVAPEDVIAVPNDEPDKMRAAAYHIVQVLPPEVHSLLRSDQPMTGHPTAAKMLADAMSGNHIGIIEDVFIGGAYGSDVTVTPRSGAAPAPELGKTMAKALDAESKISPAEIRKAADAAMDESRDELLDEIVDELDRVTPGWAGDEVIDPVATTETAKERRNRIKREKRAAAKVVAQVNAEKRAPKAKNTKVAASKVTLSPSLKIKITKRADAPATPIAGVKPESELPETHQKALKLLDQGLSGRDIAKQITICRKTLSKLKATYRS